MIDLNPVTVIWTAAYGAAFANAAKHHLSLGLATPTVEEADCFAIEARAVADAACPQYRVRGDGRPLSAMHLPEWSALRDFVSRSEEGRALLRAFEDAARKSES